MFEKNAKSAIAVKWSYRPYRPMMVDMGDIYVNRIAPQPDKVSVSWMTEDAQTVDIYWRKRGMGEYARIANVTGGTGMISGLEKEYDYEFYLQDRYGHRSLTRLVRTGDYIGVPIQYLHPDDLAYNYSGRYVGSPTIVRQPDGSLLASMDVFEGTEQAPQNLSLIYRSDDNGQTWQWQCEIYPCLWGKLFVYRGEVYLLGCSTEHGDILIGKAENGGKSFTAPTVLVRGPSRTVADGPDMSPEPPAVYNGRIWFNFHWGSWVKGRHHACLLSAPVDADLLDAANWTASAPCVYDENWPGVARGKSRGTLEGTFAVLPDGKLYMLARYEIKDCEPNYGLAVLYGINTDDPAAPPEFERVIPFDGNHSKFTVIRDEESGWYCSIISRIRGSENTHDRNLLSLIKSPDCIRWTTVKDLVDLTGYDHWKVGVQYVDFFIEGDDIYYVCRAGINNANSFHNSNTNFFTIIRDFRAL